MPTKTKMDFIDEIAARDGIQKSTVKMVVHQFLNEIVSELAKGNRLEFRDFGVFEIRKTPPRTAQNPKTMEPIEVPARRRVKFKAGRGMKERMNGHA
jgi:integration host factor subunit beta